MISQKQSRDLQTLERLRNKREMSFVRARLRGAAFKIKDDEYLFSAGQREAYEMLIELLEPAK